MGDEAVNKSATTIASGSQPATGVNNPRFVPSTSAEAQPLPPNETYIVTIGSAMLDQFVPWYFGVAFAFLFKYCAGMPNMPDWNLQPRYRRTLDAPRIELPLWVRVMARRIESQLHRDCHRRHGAHTDGAIF